MKILLLALLALATPLVAQDIIDLHHQTATFTNLLGRVYEHVQLDRATLDGLIYSSTNDATVGMVRYETLSTNFLASWNIPADRIQIAARREAILAAQTKQYDAASRLLAAKEQQEEQSNTNHASQVQARPSVDHTPAASATSANTTKARRHKKNG